MTSAAITAELAALDARRAELEQLSADLDNGQVTAKQIERYPVVDPHGSAKKHLTGLEAEAFAIPATLADESHEEASV
jgi:hypothetical protein